jgi:hypothetical protein
VQTMTKRGMWWLSAAAEDPEECRKVWQDDPRVPYVVPAGLLFDVVSVDLRLGMEALDLLRRRRMPLGPVAVDYRSRRVGFLVPSGARCRFERWLIGNTLQRPEYRYLELGSYVVLPGPGALSQDRYQWLAAPVRRPESTLRRTAALALMLVAAAETLERADRYGQLFPPGAVPEEEGQVCAAGGEPQDVARVR